jgi:SAM-dependent methyltransferase
MNFEENPSSIKYHVKKYLIKNQDRFKGKTVIDFPAGNGITSKTLKDIGAQPLAFDLFPEYFDIEGLTCTRANISEGIPVDDASSDFLICQEGIEHFSDQLASFKEFNRILTKKGKLIITTPNYSSLRAKMSYLLSESERFNSILAPNELDSIWMSKQSITNEIYYGHIFLIGILKLRCIGKLSGFKIKHIQKTKIKTTSLLLFLFFYPFILVSNWITYKKRMRKNKDFNSDIKKQVYKEIFNLSIHPRILIDGHLFVEFEKEHELNEVANVLKSNQKEFGIT